MSISTLTEEQILTLWVIDDERLYEIAYKYFAGFSLNELFSKASLARYRKELFRYGIDINKPLEEK